MSARELAIYAGKLADGTYAWVQIAIEPDAGQSHKGPHEVTYTDHTTGPAPERVSLTGVVTSVKRARLRDVPDGAWVASGRIAEALGQIAKPGDLTPAEVATLRRVWASAHLNDMNAACDHMTEDMLNPSEDVLNAYVAERPERGRYGRTSALQSWRLDNVRCPETGYKWGAAWLARKVAASDLDALRAIQSKSR